MNQDQIETYRYMLKRISDDELQQRFILHLEETIRRGNKRRRFDKRPAITNGKDCGPTRGP